MSAPRDPLAPPRGGGTLRAIALAVLVHAILIVALTVGLEWKHTSPEQPAIEAEIWAAAAPQAAAPAAATAPQPAPEPEPEPAPPPAPEPEPEPAPPPEPEPEPEPEPTGPSEADIALEREKEIQRLQAEKEHLLQLERERQEKQERERQLALQREKEKAEKEKQQQEAKRKEQQKRQAEARRAEELRQDQLRRLAQLAGGGGGESGGSNAPSASYAGRVAARVKPNITYNHTTAGNPHAIAEVRTAPDGTIVSVRIVSKSGTPAWDEAVVRALHKTEILPRDVDGRVPEQIVIGFRPNDF